MLGPREADAALAWSVAGNDHRADGDAGFVGHYRDVHSIVGHEICQELRLNCAMAHHHLKIGTCVCAGPPH
jgi:hypothetical protein